MRTIPLSAIRELAVLFPGDLHELATFLLKACDALDREAYAKNPGTIQRSRPTLHGLATYYACVTGVRVRRVEEVLAKAGFARGGILEFDPADCVDEEGPPPGPT